MQLDRAFALGLALLTGCGASSGPHGSRSGSATGASMTSPPSRPAPTPTVVPTPSPPSSAFASGFTYSLPRGTIVYADDALTTPLGAVDESPVGHFARALPFGAPPPHGPGPLAIWFLDRVAFVGIDAGGFTVTTSGVSGAAVTFDDAPITLPDGMRNVYLISPGTGGTRIRGYDRYDRATGVFVVDVDNAAGVQLNEDVGTSKYPVFVDAHGNRILATAGTYVVRKVLKNPKASHSLEEPIAWISIDGNKDLVLVNTTMPYVKMRRADEPASTFTSP